MGYDPKDIMGYRYSVVEGKIKECLEAAKRGETSVEIDADDMTPEEISYVRSEVRRRLSRG